jgi:hypothetical protein
MYVDPFGRESLYAPPVDWVRRDGQESLGPKDWDALVGHGLEFSPYAGPTSIRMIRGTCLNPLLCAGDLITVRPVGDDEPLVDGGLYVIAWSNEEEVQVYRDSINLPATELVVEIAKFLRYIGGEWWCQCADSLARLDGIVVAMVVGMVSLSACTPEAQSVHARQPLCGDPFDAESVAGAQLGNNAASQILSAAFSGIFPASIFGITVAANSTTALTSVFTMSGTMSGAPVAIDLIMGLSVTTITGATSWSAAVTVYRDGAAIAGATTATLRSTNSVWAAGTGQTYPIALTLVDGSPTSGAHTYAIMITGTVSGGTANATVNATTCSFKVREIKR